MAYAIQQNSHAKKYRMHNLYIRQFIPNGSQVPAKKQKNKNELKQQQHKNTAEGYSMNLFWGNVSFKRCSRASSGFWERTTSAITDDYPIQFFSFPYK